jgi:deazaflavin-dependent oxidoreductase (nitroreductase family)
MAIVTEVSRSEAASTESSAAPGPITGHGAARDGAALAANGGIGATAQWGEGLAYPEWVLGLIPALHGGFNAVNKYLSVPALKMGMGRYMSNPLTGYLMILRTRGRKSGEMRDAPLGYTIVGDHVYCLAGFGPRTHWYQNILADPQVEVILPSRAFSGVAEEVTEADERRRVLAPLLRSMGVIAGMMGLGNPWRDSPDEIARKCDGMPLVRVRATGIAVGPEDPGGRYWVMPVVATVIGLGWILGRRRRTRSKK